MTVVANASRIQSRFQSLSASEVQELEKTVSHAWDHPENLQKPAVQNSIIDVLRYLESGALRVAGPVGSDPRCGAVEMTGELREWQVFAWVKQAVLLALRLRVPVEMGAPVMPWSVLDGDPRFAQGRVHGGNLQYFDKLDARTDWADSGVRIVPPGVVREGAHMARGTILMPGYVNIGAYVSAGTMVDTWATVGSCAQIGRNVHLAGGVGIGGVLEPAGARPVIIGDNAFVGSRAIVVEGAVVSAGAVLGANTCITASTPIYDVTTDQKTEHRGYVPPLAVVAPGTRAKQFPGGEVQLQCAYIIAYRSAQTDAKVSLNAILRETGISV